MMNYTEMSDFEINKAVAVALGGKATTDNMGMAIYDMGDNPPLVVSQFMHSKGDFLPCNSWADAGQIIEKNGISITKFDHGMWLASSDAYWVDGDEWQIGGEASQNPLRAAMIVFLMMQESK